MRGILHWLGGLALVLILASCAAPRESGSSSALASTQISADPLHIFQAATEVMGRYSYSVSQVQYPISATFEKTGNSPNRLAAGSPAPITLQLEPAGSGQRVSLTGAAGNYQLDAVRMALEEIKAASR